MRINPSLTSKDNTTWELFSTLNGIISVCLLLTSDPAYRSNLATILPSQNLLTLLIVAKLVGTWNGAPDMKSNTVPAGLALAVNCNKLGLNLPVSGFATKTKCGCVL